MIAAVLAVAAAASLWDQAFTLARAGEATATLRARCPACDWSSPTRTAAMLVLDVDGRDPRNLLLYRGEGPAEYAVSLGGLRAGVHRLRVRLDPRATARDVRSATVEDVRVDVTTAEAPEYPALAHAPVLHPRPNAVGRFTDVPLVLWYE